MKTWFSIKAQANADAPAEISIHDAIGSWYINAQDFLAQLKNITAKDITLTINSPGGSVFDGIAIYNGLRAHSANITVRVLGVAASIASVIAMAGDKIIMPENTFMMVHSPLNALYGNAGEMRDMADLLDKVESSLLATYAARTGMSPEDIKVLLDAETFMTAAEAVKLGFADEMEPALKIAASFELENLPQNIRDVFDAANNAKATTEALAVEDEPVAEVDTGPVATFAEQVNALATGAGLEAHTSVWMLDASITSVVEARVAIAEAAEVNALCVYAKKPELAEKMIGVRTSISAARAQLCALRVAEVEVTNVKSEQPSNKLPLNVPQAGVTSTSIWAARINSTGARK